MVKLTATYILDSNAVSKFFFVEKFLTLLGSTRKSRLEGPVSPDSHVVELETAKNLKLVLSDRHVDMAASGLLFILEALLVWDP